MESKNRQLIAMAVIVLIVGALFASFGRSLFALNIPSVELPDPGSSGSASSQAPSASDPYHTVAVTPDTVQSVIATLARSDSYYRELTVETLWTGGSSATAVQVWIDGGWSHCVQVLPSGATRHDLAGDGTLYYWYSGSSQYESLPVDEAAADLAQRIPTYETVLAQDPAAITDAGYEVKCNLPCVFLQVQAGEDRTTRYWVGVDSGLLISAETEVEGQLIYRMTAPTPVQSPCPANASFALPNGTALHTIS